MLDALTFHRVAHAIHQVGLQRSARLLSVLSRMLFSAQIYPETPIGPGCVIGYGGIGVVIHRGAVIGRDVVISPGVVVGGRSGLLGLPVIEDGACLGAGAKILGPIRIGKGAIVGANAVVLHDVAPGATVAGVPAREIRKSGTAKAEEKAKAREGNGALSAAQAPAHQQRTNGSAGEEESRR